MIFNFGKYKDQDCTDLPYLVWVFCKTDRKDVDYQALADEIIQCSNMMAHTFDKNEMLADREEFWNEFQDTWEEYNDSAQPLYHECWKY